MTSPVDPALTGPTSSPANAGQHNPILTALYQMTVTVLGEQLREMFDRADDILFDFTEKAGSSDEQRLYMDTMRAVRLQRSKIIELFQKSLEKALSRVGDDPDPRAADPTDDISQWSLESGDALEERLAVSNMETKAASAHAHELGELKRRLANLSDLAGGVVSDEAMSPGRIIRSFQDSMHDLPVDFPTKLVIYKLFDRVVLNRLADVFTGANQLLAGHGVGPKAGPETARPASRDRRTVQDNAPSPAVPPWAAHLDPATIGAFGGATGIGQAPAYPASPGYGSGGHGAAPPAWSAGGGDPGADAGVSDAMLAHEISNILTSYGQGKRPQAPAWLPPESVALVARMFDGYYRDSRLPERLKPALGKLQMPIMKAALSDRRFFSDAQHPARRIINDLFEMLLQFGADPDAEQVTGDLHNLIDAVAQSFKLDPASVQEEAKGAPDENTAQSFLHEQESVHQQKNKARVERVRRIVAHELRRRIGERQLGSGVMRLMLSGFAPILSMDYIRSGSDSPPWNETMQLIDRVLASLLPYQTGEDPASRRGEESAIVAAITHRLARIGFTEEHSVDILSGLLSQYRETAAAQSRGEPPPSVAPAEPVRSSTARDLHGLLSILLVPSTWYTLVDEDKTKHWVRVKSYYPAQNAVLFSHYMEPRYIRLRATTFATSLIEGLAAPIEPSTELRSAAERIGEIPFPRSREAIVWTAAEPPG